MEGHNAWAQIKYTIPIQILQLFDLSREAQIYIYKSCGAELEHRN